MPIYLSLALSDDDIQPSETITITVGGKSSDRGNSARGLLQVYDVKPDTSQVLIYSKKNWRLQSQSFSFTTSVEGTHTIRADFTVSGVVPTVSLPLTVSSLAPPPPTEQPKTDYATYPEPPLPTRPASAGLKVTDPTFGTVIMRVSDANDGTYCGTVYSYWPTFNCDNTRIAVGFEDGMFFRDFDPVTYTLGTKRTPSAMTTINWGGGTYWSKTNPDIIYGLDLGLTLYSYNVATNTYAVVKDFSALFDADRYLFQLSASDDVDVISATVRRASDWGWLGYMAYKLSTATMIVKNETESDINETHMAKGGGWVSLDLDDPQRVKVINLSTLAEQVLLYSQDGLSHNTMQTAHILGYTSYSTATMSRWPLTNVVPATREILQDSSGNFGYGTGGGHVSCLANDESWAMGSTFGTTQAGPFRNEIYLCSTNGEQSVYRFCHHRSVYSAYYDSPRPNISRDGKWVAFTSNWGGSGRLDLYIVNIPDSPAAT